MVAFFPCPFYCEKLDRSKMWWDWRANELEGKSRTQMHFDTFYTREKKNRET